MFTSEAAINTIATLVFHINYVSPVLKVLQGEPLNASDKFSFDLQPITSADDWQKLVSKVFTEAGLFASQIEKLDEEKLLADFAGQKYVNYYRNLPGIIEHTHYHPGQISLIKKILNGDQSNPLSVTKRVCRRKEIYKNKGSLNIVFRIFATLKVKKPV